MKDCERCFWLRFNRGIHRPRGVLPTLPDGVDSVLKAHFDRFREKGELPPELAKSGFNGGLMRNQLLIDEWRKNGLKTEIPELGVSVLGKVDDVLVDSDGETLVPFDFKTKGSPPTDGYEDHYHHQMCLYGWLMRQNGYKVDDKAYLMFYHPETVDDAGEIIFSTSLIKIDIDPSDAVELLERASRLLNSPEPESNKNCEYCKYRDSKLG
jgi:hypothetical protein